MKKEQLEKYQYTNLRKFRIADFNPSEHGDYASREEAVDEFVDTLKKINKEQQKLYAEGKEGIIFIFQAMDAAGKDGTIRTVFSTLSPHGVKEYCFKVPSSVELSHDFLWRFWSALPARGNISIFNRSYYEDVLVGKVHRLYNGLKLPDRIKKAAIIEERYEQIKEFEEYLYRTGTRVVKIFLHISKEEQARRFIARMDTPEKNWKISESDIRERQYWQDYMEAFETMVNKTSTVHCPWFVVPADHKWYTRLVVSSIVLDVLKQIDPKFPVMCDERMRDCRQLYEELCDSLHETQCPDEPELGVFADTETISSALIYKEETEKINEKKKSLKASGFGQIRRMLSSGYILKSNRELAGAIGDAVKQVGNHESVQQKGADYEPKEME